MGHVRIFTACDVMARYFRMKSNNDGDGRPQGLPLHNGVLSPMGWDAFGLPAENAAIKAKKIPQTMVPHNYANFKKQMQALSLSFDWEHEFATTDPTYYAFTQWLFLKLYEKGLVYRENVPINWCPKCKTGIANEEVLGDGTHERCGTVTGKKLLPQWVMKITDYAERLLADLDVDLDIKGKKLDESRTGLDWPKGILEMQRNWIGKKEGARVRFGVAGSKEIIKELEVFTTRIDTINGVTFVVIAPEIAKQWMAQGWEATSEIKQYVENALQKSEQLRLEGEKVKTGVRTELVAVNPYNQEEVPIYVADYVLADFGTGCVMGVPQYDERDLEFATKYNLEVKNIPLDDYEVTFKKLSDQGMAKRETTYHLRDWVFSRQRYWGEPIPLVYCEKCGDKNGVVPLTEDQLPLTLPELDSYEPTDTGESPLSRVDDWVKVECPRCGGEARRETDTMPNWAGSCWYFLAYPWWISDNQKVGQPENSDYQHVRKSDIQKSTSEVIREYKQKSKTPISDFWREVAKPAIDQWLPADWYLGGAEHAVLHLLYARFWVKVFQDLGLVDFPEPFLRLRSVGMVLAEDGKKMSKSLGNVVNPDDMIAKYGSDATRMYEMFMGPWDQSIAWDSGAISGQVRFLERIRATAQQEGKVGEKTSPLLAAKLKDLVARVEDGVLNQKFNTAIAGLMEWVNAWREDGQNVAKEHFKIFVQMLSLFAPVTAQELWERVGGKGLCAEQGWPDVTGIAGVEKLGVRIAVQVNGKVRSILEVESAVAREQDAVLALAMADERVKKWVVGQPKRIVFVAGKLLSLVV